RDRLKELGRALETVPPSSFAETGAGDPAQGEHGLTHCLFPPGCKNLEQAVAHLLSGVAGPDVDQLDQKMPAIIKSQFMALVHVCLGSTNMLKGMEKAMQQVAEGILAEKLAGDNVVGMYLTLPDSAGPGDRGGRSADRPAQAAPADPAARIGRAFQN